MTFLLYFVFLDRNNMNIFIAITSISDILMIVVAHLRSGLWVTMYELKIKGVCNSLFDVYFTI